MTLEEWCYLAQNDQNTDIISNLYANYRHTNRRALITPDGMRSFEEALDGHPTGPTVYDKNGPSNLAVTKANDIQYRGVVAPHTDFRIAGHSIKLEGTWLINLARLRPNMTSTGVPITGLKPSLPE